MGKKDDNNPWWRRRRRWRRRRHSNCNHQLQWRWRGGSWFRCKPPSSLMLGRK